MSKRQQARRAKEKLKKHEVHLLLILHVKSKAEVPGKEKHMLALGGAAPCAL